MSTKWKYFDEKKGKCEKKPKCKENEIFNEKNGKCESNNKCTLSTQYYDDKLKKCVTKPKCNNKEYFDESKKNIWLKKNVKKI